MTFSQLPVGRGFLIVSDELKRLNRPLLRSDFPTCQLPLLKLNETDASVSGHAEHGMKISPTVTVHVL